MINVTVKNKLKQKYKKALLSESFSGEGVILSQGNAKGVIIKGVSSNEKIVLVF